MVRYSGWPPITFSLAARQRTTKDKSDATKNTVDAFEELMRLCWGESLSLHILRQKLDVGPAGAMLANLDPVVRND